MGRSSCPGPRTVISAPITAGLMSFDQTSLAPTGVFMDTPNGYEGGFWGGGSGPIVDAAGSIYTATGNGWFDVNNGGIDYGDSVLRLTWSGSGIAVADYFTPWDQQTLDDDDADVNSGGVVLLPDQSGSYPHLMLQVGKEGTIDLINRDNMGHFHAGNDHQIVQTLPFIIGGVWGAPAFWNNNAYFGGQYDHLKAFLSTHRPGFFPPLPTSASPESFAFPGPTPAVSSSGTSNGIVWVVEAGLLQQRKKAPFCGPTTLTTWAPNFTTPSRTPCATTLDWRPSLPCLP